MPFELSHDVRVAEIGTLRTRLEAAEVAYDEMIVEGRGIVEYREADGTYVKKDPAQMRAYVDYLRTEIAAKATGSGRTFAAFARPR